MEPNRAREEAVALEAESAVEPAHGTADTLARAARRAFEIGEELDWKSYDPFDLLLSPYLQQVRKRSRLAARVLVQLGKRSGSRLRRTLRIAAHEEPKALADFMRASALLVRGGEDWASEYATELSDRLRQRATVASAGHGWGLGFPYASRFVSIDAETPNVYTTTEACQAFLEEYELTGNAPSLEAAVPGARFILDGLGTFQHRDRTWLRYTPGSMHPVINVQASAAAMLVRVAEHTGDERLLQAADRAVETVVATQRDDGSWAYSDDGRGDFVDGFHTGFTLQGLQEYARRRGEGSVPRVADSVAAGFGYFRDHLLTADALPRGFADASPSLDPQNVAQCIQTLLVCGDAADARNALRVWRIGVGDRLLSERPRADQRLPGLRWDLGPSVLATAYLSRASAAVG